MDKPVLRIVTAETKIRIRRSELNTLLHKFYHYLQGKDVFCDPLLRVACGKLIRDFVEAQEWVEE